MDIVIRITATADGEALKGACSFCEHTMVVAMTQPFPAISTAVVFPENTFSEEYAENWAKDLLVELYGDYNLIVAHQDEIRAALPGFYQQRDLLTGPRGDVEKKAGVLFGKMIENIIGKRCCIDALEAKVTAIVEDRFSLSNQ